MSKIVVSLLLCCTLAAAQTPAPGAAPPAAPAAAALKPFADIVKDAQVIQGLFTLYRTEEKVFLEILPDQLDKLYLINLTLESGLGERGFYAAAMGGNRLAVFHKEGKNIQLIAKSARYTAQDGTPIRRAVAKSFSDSIMGMTKIESLPHPERKSVLIDLGAILLTDVPLLSWDLEATYRIPYRFDARNSVFGAVKSFPRNTEIETIAHYAVERPPLPPLLAPGATPPPMPPPPGTIPDVRSLRFRLRYGLVELPPADYRPRLADDRVGHFFVQHEDYTDDLNYSPSRRYIRRWRLEKQNPSAALSKPKEPIVFWMENNIPVKYRDAIKEGVLLWNKAFAKIGFQDAIEVRQQPDNPDWDAADVRYSTLRWIINTDSAFAQGPSLANPLTGQTYDADIRFSESMTRFFRREAAEDIQPISWTPQERPRLLSHWNSASAEDYCDLGQGKAADAGFAFDVLMARGMEPGSAESDEFMRQYLVEIAAHEVGHTLGLRHNFRASTIHAVDKLQDKSVTSTQGLTGSVMDYIATNVALDRSKQGEYHQTTLGPWDYWAIEYAYKPIDAPTPQAELPELRRIAARSAEPLLAYATDQDAGFGNGMDMDPTANRFDLGSDPLQYYAHRIKLGQEVWKNMESKLQKPGEGYQILRRSFGSAFGQTGQALLLAAKYIGGVQQFRDHVGDPNGRLPFQYIPAARQKEALDLLRKNLFAPTAFQFSPQLLSKLVADHWSPSGASRFDYPVHAQVLSLQRAALDRLHHPAVLARVLDAEVKTTNPFTISQLFNGVQDAVWSDARATGETVSINTYRRSLQREHLKRLAGLVLRDANALEDARTMARASLTSLRGQLQATLGKPGVKMSAETRAHLNESLARIDEALKAGIQRTAF